MKESDFTPEQLMRPTQNYVSLCHQVLSTSSMPLSLQQIYASFQKKWPYFKFREQTNGWQSSIRHNLQQHPAFKKAGMYCTFQSKMFNANPDADKDGKGFTWTIEPGVSVEKEKKRRSSPQPQAALNAQRANAMHFSPYGATPGQPHNGQPQPPPYMPTVPVLPPSLRGTSQTAPASQPPAASGMSTFLHDICRLSPNFIGVHKWSWRSKVPKGERRASPLISANRCLDSIRSHMLLLPHSYLCHNC